MILHNPIVSGSLSFAAGANLVANNGTVSGSSQITDGSGIVSSSSQISAYNTFLEINGDGVISGSSQVNADSITNFDTNVRDYIRSIDVVSGSITHYTDSDNLTYLNSLGVISGSSQVNADSVTNFDTNVRDYIRSIDVISGSSQVQAGSITGDIALGTQTSGNYVATLGTGTGVTIGSNTGEGSTPTIAVDYGSTAGTAVQGNTSLTIQGTTNEIDVTDGSVTLGSGGTVTIGLSDSIAGNRTFQDDITISGNLTVNGTTTTAASTNTIISDTLIELGNGTTGSPSNDSGIIIERGDSANAFIGFDESADKFIVGTGVFTGASTGDLTITKGTLLANIEGNVTGQVSDLSNHTTDDLTENTNLYYTDTRVKTKLDTEGVVSGSSQISLSGVTGNTDNVSEGSSNLYYTDIRVRDYIRSQDVVSGSINQYTDSNNLTYLNSLGVISGSSQVNADTITNFDSNVKAKLNDEGVISGSSQITITESQISDLSHYSDSDVESYIRSIDVISGSSQVDGTAIQNNTISIAGNSTALGGSISFASIAAGTGTVSGSIQLLSDLDGRYTKIDGDGVISGSSQVTLSSTTGYNANEHFTQANITTVGTVTSGNVTAILPSGVISSSAQVEGDFLNTNGEGVFSGSSQVDVTATTNYSSINQYSDAKVKTKLNDEGVISGSSQITITESQISDLSHFTNSDWDTRLATKSTTNLSEGSNLYYTDARVKTKLNTEGVISSSAQLTTEFDARYVTDLGEGAITSSAQVDGTSIQNNTITIAGNSTALGGTVSLSNITDGTGIISGSGQLTSDFDSRYLNTNGDGVISSSAQVVLNSADKTGFDTDDVTEGSTNLYYTDARVKTKLNAEGVFSSSAQIEGEFLNTNGDGVFSGSAQVDGASIQNNTISIAGNSTALGGSVSLASITDGTGIISGSSQLTSDFDTRYLNTNGDSIVSSSSQINLASVSGNSTTNVSEGTNKYYTDTRVRDYIRSIDVISGSSQLTTEFDVRYLNTNGDGVISGSSQVDGTSISNNTITIAGNSTALGGSVSLASITDGTGIVSGSSQLRADLDNTYLEINGDGVISGSSQVTLSQVSGYNSNEHFTQGNITTVGTVTAGNVDAILPRGIVSGSSQLDTEYLNANGDGVISGSSQVNHDSTTGFVSNEHIDHSTVAISSGNGLTGGGDITTSRTLSVGQGDGISVTANAVAVDSTVLRTTGDGVISGSSQVDVTSTTNYGSINQYSDTKVRNYIRSIDVISGSSQVDVTATTNYSGINQYSDTKVRDYIRSIDVVSGSITHYTDSDTQAYIRSIDVVSGSATQVRSFLNVEDGADVTDTANVSSAGALMDSELASITDVKALNQSVVSGASPNFSTTNMTDATNKRFMTDAQETKLDSVESSADVTDATNVTSALVAATGISSGNKTTIRTNLGVDTAGTDNSTDVTLLGSYDYITISGQAITRNQVDASTDISNLTTTNVSEGTNKYYTDTRVRDYIRSIDVVSGSASTVRSFLNVEDGADVTDTANVKSALNANLGTLTLGDSDDTVSIPGNLTVSGTTNFVNSNTLNIGDNNIVLNADVTGTPTQNGGITIERGTETNATLIWDETNDYWKAGLASSEVQIALVNGTYSGLRAQSTTAGDVGLGNVENTALSTWAGSSNITTLGTISTGTWNGTAIADGYISSATAWNAKLDSAGTIATNDYAKYDASGDLVGRSYSEVKSDLSLNNVENTAVSTWAGSSNITTLGTIGTGTWQGTAIADGYISSATAWNSKLDSAGTIATNDYAKYDANGDLIGRSYTEVKTDLSLNNVENTALSTYTGNGGALDNQYITNGAGYITGYSETDTLATVTGRGASTSTAISITNSTASTSKTTGALKVTGGVGISGALNVGGDVVAYASSDERLKDNIELISNPIEKVKSLKGVTWNWNENADELQQSLPNVGVIAQDVEKVLPQLVHDRDNGYKGVDYAKLTGLLIEAIKEQQKEIDELKSKIQ